MDISLHCGLGITTSVKDVRAECIQPVVLWFRVIESPELHDSVWMRSLWRDRPSMLPSVTGCCAETLGFLCLVSADNPAV